MRYRIGMTLVSATALAIGAATAGARQEPASSPRKVALVELYTSQG